MKITYEGIFSRNTGLFSETEQNSLRNATIGIAGVGGVGGLLIERLIRAGIGRLKFTDPGTFEPSNLNRQFGSSCLTLDKNKSEIVFHQVKDINPEAEIKYYENGLQQESDIEKFVDGCDIVIDEMDTTAFKQSILLQRASRNHGLYYIFSSAIGFGGLAVVFDPVGQTLEEYNGLTPGVNLDSLAQMTISPEKAVPIMPTYVRNISREILEKIFKGETPIPTTSIGAGVASLLAASETINVLLKKREVITAPRYIYLDLFDLKFSVATLS